jgi:hypothetical protein
MRFALLLWVLFLLPDPAAAQNPPGRCAFGIDTLTSTIGLRSLAGAYDLDWISSSGMVRRERLWLWPTLSTDSSLTLPRIRPSPSDSLRYPLWGTTTHRSIPLNAEDSLRRVTDPISPPVLLITPFVRGDPPTLLVGTVTTRRPNVMSLDGAGVGLWLSHADGQGLAGKYRPYGIVVTDSGFACARRAK